MLSFGFILWIETLDCDEPLMSSLARKLAVVLLIKLAVLTALWWGFVREQRVHVDGDSVAAQFLLPVVKPAEGKNP